MRVAKVAEAEHLLRAYLDTDPDDPQALRMLAEIAAVCGHGNEAERLLRKALAMAPAFVPLYINLAALLQDLGRTGEALELLDSVLSNAPDNNMVLSYKAGLLLDAGRINEALQTHESLLALAPEAAVVWMNYGHALQIAGRTGEAVNAFRRSLRHDPGSGFAWWGLANLRACVFGRRDIDRMRTALAVADDSIGRLQLHFALGKALGDQQCFEESFSHYATANEMRGTLIPYDPRPTVATARKTESLFTREFVRAREDFGAIAADPIFIVGLPRAGSTLVEQILASHPLVEGAGELPDFERLAISIAREAGTASWQEALAELDAEALRAHGEAYLASARARLVTDRPFFTDKMPFNWSMVGLIHLVLPNARIVDVRRHPMACCFANFTQYFSRTVNFPSSLEDIGRYYRIYVRMMAHFDDLLPGRVYRLLYERLVDDPDGQIRLMLEYLDLPFAGACLRFHENPRAIYTPSAAQVRQPIHREGLDRWRQYEPWLGPLRAALGPLPDLYPATPAAWPGDSAEV